MRTMAQLIIQKIHKDNFCFSEHYLCALREGMEWVLALKPTESIMGVLKNGESLHGSELFPLHGNSQLYILQPCMNCKEIKQETNFLGHSELHLPRPCGHKLDFDVFKQLRSYQWCCMDEDSQKIPNRRHKVLPCIELYSSSAFHSPNPTQYLK